MNTRIALFAFAVLLVAAQASAQTTASQKYRVKVPTNISITAPSDTELDHLETDAPLVFAPQQWTVKGNVLSGVSVSFATATAFTHTTDPSFKRDASLSLAVAGNSGPAAWNITQATDQTDYVNADEVATVQAASDGVGRATFDLSVSFITGEYGTFAAGDYDTTVTGTVTAN